MIAVNFHTKTPLVVAVRTVKSGGVDLTVLRVKADGDMVDLYIRSVDDAYALLNSVNDALDLLEAG